MIAEPGSQPRAVVLLSGGLDSTVTAAVAGQEGFALYLLTIAYRQRHAVEIEQARQVAAALRARSHTVVDVDLRALGGSALTGDLPVPKDRPEQERTQASTPERIASQCRSNPVEHENQPSPADMSERVSSVVKLRKEAEKTR